MFKKTMLAMNILADASLPHLNTLFKNHFTITTYKNNQELLQALPHHQILLCRSTLRVNASLLANTNLTCIATASSGTDHIDHAYLASRNIRLFDAKGCNAEAVANYVLSTLAYLDTHNKIPGTRVGIMGAGAVGTRVSEQLKALGFTVLCYDPPKAKSAKTNLTPPFMSCSLEAFLACDILCIHANLHDTQPHPTHDFFNLEKLTALKPNTIIINAARGGILNEEALLSLKQPITYCTDVYPNEPEINPKMIDYATLCTPHIAGHSIEAKSDAIIHISQALHQHMGLTPPQALTYPSINLENPADHWQAHALELYNPLHESMQLKQAEDKHAAFLTLRRAHKHRHNFSQYPSTKTMFSASASSPGVP